MNIPPFYLVLFNLKIFGEIVTLNQKWQIVCVYTSQTKAPWTNRKLIKENPQI